MTFEFAERDKLTEELQEKVSSLEKKLERNLSGDEHVQELLKEVITQLKAAYKYNISELFVLGFLDHTLFSPMERKLLMSHSHVCPVSGIWHTVCAGQNVWVATLSLQILHRCWPFALSVWAQHLTA